jgi:hypothetical protein
LIVILITIFLYFKKILNKPIPTFSSFFISKVYAQDKIQKTTKTKTKIMDYKELKLDKLVFTISFNLNGFTINPTSSTAPESCAQMKLFSTKLALILFKEQNIREDWKKYFEKCSFELNKNMSAMLAMKKKVFTNTAELNIFLTPYKFTEQMKKVIQDVYNNKNSHQSDIRELKMFISVSKELHSLTEEKEKYFVIEKYKKEGEVKNTFFKNLIDLNYALSIKNFSWAKSILIDLVYYNKLRFINDIQGHYFSSEKQVEEFKKAILVSLELAYKKLQYKDLIQILVNNYSEIFGKETLQQTINLVSAGWSLAEIREKASSITFGRQFPDFWYNQLLERTTKLELNLFLERNIKEKYINLISLHSYGLFYNYLPKDDKVRNLIVNNIIKFNKKKDCYTEGMTSYLLQSEIIKRKLSENNKHYSKANFNLRRAHHRRCINKGVGIKFHLYSLLHLGDKDEKLLWWLLL